MIWIQFYHDGEQLYDYRVDEFGLIKRIRLALRIILREQVALSSMGGDANRAVGGIKYKV